MLLEEFDDSLPLGCAGRKEARTGAGLKPDLQRIGGQEEKEVNTVYSNLIVQRVTWLGAGKRQGE